MHCERRRLLDAEQIPVARAFARKERPRAASAARVGIAWQERLRDELGDECFATLVIARAAMQGTRGVTQAGRPAAAVAVVRFTYVRSDGAEACLLSDDSARLQASPGFGDL